MKKRQITIKDLARKLDISVSTVSRALRDMPDVNPETKKSVRQLAKELEYEPNQVALSLVTRKTNLVGVIIPDYRIHFYSSALSGIQKTLNDAGYHSITCQSGESYQNEVSIVHALLACRVDGIICSISRETENIDHLKLIMSKGLPLVLFNRVSKDIDTPKVMVNDYEGAISAVEHLVSQGYKRIAHMAGPPSLHICQNRKNGYLDALKKHALPVEDDLIVTCDFTMADGERCMQQLLELTDPPDAVFVVCDNAAFGAMQTIKKNGLSIPHDIALVGFTDELTASLLEPPLTSVAQPTTSIGRTAAKVFLDQIALDPEERTALTISLQTHLNLRRSSLQEPLSH